MLKLLSDVDLLEIIQKSRVQPKAERYAKRQQKKEARQAKRAENKKIRIAKKEANKQKRQANKQKKQANNINNPVLDPTNNSNNNSPTANNVQNVVANNPYSDNYLNNKFKQLEAMLENNGIQAGTDPGLIDKAKEMFYNLAQTIEKGVEGNKLLNDYLNIIKTSCRDNMNTVKDFSEGKINVGDFAVRANLKELIRARIVTYNQKAVGLSERLGVSGQLGPLSGNVHYNFTDNSVAIRGAVKANLSIPQSGLSNSPLDVGSISTSGGANYNLDNKKLETASMKVNYDSPTLKIPGIVDVKLRYIEELTGKNAGDKHVAIQLSKGKKEGKVFYEIRLNTTKFSKFVNNVKNSVKNGIDKIFNTDE